MSIRVTTIAFDGDDTLWHNEGLFSMTQERFRTLLADAVAGDVLDARLLETERENVAVYGYGVKGFTLSMIETAIEVTNGNIAADRIYQILSFAKDQLSHPVELLPHVTETLDALAGRYRLLLVTKGDIFDQESKIARSGLAERFDVIEVVPEKEPEVYRRVLDRHDIEPHEFLMVGNSVRSDVLPVLEIGGRAALVPYHLTWELEVAEPPHEHDGYWEIEHIGQVPALVGDLDPRGSVTVEPGVDGAIVERLRQCCRVLPEFEETSDRWGYTFKVRRRVFVYLFSVEDPNGNTPTMLVCRADPDERAALVASGHPYFAPRSGQDRLGIVIDDATDWTEIGELVTESFRLHAPKKLAAELE